MKEIPEEIRRAIDALLMPYETNLTQLLGAKAVVDSGTRPEKFISVRETGERLSLSKASVFRLMRDGLITGKKIGSPKSTKGGRCLILEDSVKRYVASLPDWIPADQR